MAEPRTSASPSGSPIRVAVIGGGCAALTAAFELTRPEHQGRFAVTVYQQGFRLGGKGASGRGPADRIEEHGLHLWMGFYENAFRIMRECYAELDRDPEKCRIARWTDAFVPAPLVGAMARRPDGSWIPWVAELPPQDGLPGDPLPAQQKLGVIDYLLRSVRLVRRLLDAFEKHGDEAQRTDPSAWPQGDVMVRIRRWLDLGELVTLAALVEAVSLVEVVLGSLAEYPQNLLLRFLDSIAMHARQILESRLAEQPERKRVWEVIDVTLAAIRGEIRFGVLSDPRGFEVLDAYDCREWLLLNGASPASVDSPFIRALYDLGFAYEDGDPERPRIAAGQALRGTVRAFFTYRGAFFWKMTAGMGDIVFAPLYEVLRARGVRFEFFHRLDSLELVKAEALAAGESPYVEALGFDVQAEIAGGGEYAPLVDVRGLPCWPSRPDFSQLVDGAQLESEGRDFESHWEKRCVRRKVLRVSEDFDFVVLGVGIGAVPYVCRELVARDPRWRSMVDHVRSVPTQALQIWLREDMEALGWSGPPANVSGFVHPFDTWADMRHLIAEESFVRPPRALAYFCSALPDASPAEQQRDDYAALRRDEVRRNAVRFLNRDVVQLWPRAQQEAGSFRWDLLVDPDEDRAGAGAASERVGEKRIDTQHIQVNVNPSDRYALSLPGSLAHRISPLDPTYDNLTVAGDWTDCGFNAGCVEAAVMSGRLAAHALSQRPALEEIVGYDHP